MYTVLLLLLFLTYCFSIGKHDTILACKKNSVALAAATEMLETKKRNVFHFYSKGNDCHFTNGWSQEKDKHVMTLASPRLSQHFSDLRHVSPAHTESAPQLHITTRYTMDVFYSSHSKNLIICSVLYTKKEKKRKPLRFCPPFFIFLYNSAIPWHAIRTKVVHIGIFSQCSGTQVSIFSLVQSWKQLLENEFAGEQSAPRRCKQKAGL